MAAEQALAEQRRAQPRAGRLGHRDEVGGRLERAAPGQHQRLPRGVERRGEPVDLRRRRRPGRDGHHRRRLRRAARGRRRLQVDRQVEHRGLAPGPGHPGRDGDVLGRGRRQPDRHPGGAGRPHERFLGHVLPMVPGGARGVAEQQQDRRAGEGGRGQRGHRVGQAGSVGHRGDGERAGTPGGAVGHRDRLLLVPGRHPRHPGPLQGEPEVEVAVAEDAVHGVDALGRHGVGDVVQDEAVGHRQASSVTARQRSALRHK